MDKFYSFPEDVLPLFYELHERGYPVVFFQSEYGPTLAIVWFGEIKTEDDDFFSSIKGDFNAYWATHKTPNWLMDCFSEKIPYWWSFD